MTASSSQGQSLNLRSMASIAFWAQHRLKHFTSSWKKYSCSGCREDFIQHSRGLMLPIKRAAFHHCYPAVLPFTPTLAFLLLGAFSFLPPPLFSYPSLLKVLMDGNIKALSREVPDFYFWSRFQ